MPEGPEVKRNAVQLSDAITGSKILSAKVNSGRYTKKPMDGLQGFLNNLPSRVLSVNCRGKFIYLKFDCGINLWSTLGMTGIWSKRNTKHTRFTLQKKDGNSVFFNDIRNFGTLKFVHGQEKLAEKLLSLGPDMLSENVSDEIFLEKLRKVNRWNVCKALMNQSVISGVGNYIKAEALWQTRISPKNTVSDLSDKQLISLKKSISSIMTISYETGGATFISHKDFDGQPGRYGNRFQCYGRKVDVDGLEVVKTKTPDGRSTHWVPQRQN